MEVVKNVAGAVRDALRRWVSDDAGMEKVGKPKRLRAHKLHGGKFLDAFNEKLAEKFENRSVLPQLHPTKGFRRLSRRRLSAGERVEASIHGWCLLAAKLTGSSVGGAERERESRAHRPHQGNRECARRRRQMGLA